MNSWETMKNLKLPMICGSLAADQLVMSPHRVIGDLISGQG